MREYDDLFSDYKNFKCISCGKFVITEIYMCEIKMQLSCAQCHQYFGSCPACNTSENHQIRCTTLENRAAKLKFPCSYKEYGCVALISHKQRSKHERACKFRQIECPCHCLNSSVHIHRNTQVVQHCSPIEPMKNNCTYLLRNECNWPHIPRKHQILLQLDQHTFMLKWKICLAVRSLIILSISCNFMRKTDNDGPTPAPSQQQAQLSAQSFRLLVEYVKDDEVRNNLVPVVEYGSQNEYLLKFQFDGSQDVYSLKFIVERSQ